MVITGKRRALMPTYFLCLLLAYAVGCGGGGGTGDDGPAIPPTPQKLKPKLSISVHDDEGKIVPPGVTVSVAAGTEVALEFDTQFCTLTDPNEAEPESKTPCHYRIYLDSAADAQLLMTGYTEFAHPGIPSVTPVGTHLLLARLYYHDGEYTGASESVYIHVTELGEAAGIDIVSPETGKVFAPGAVVSLEVEVGHVTLVPIEEDFEPENCDVVEDSGSDVGACSNGQACLDGVCITLIEAHYRVYMDDLDGDDYLLATHETGVDVPLPEGLKGGKHALRVSLRHTDSSPYVSAVNFGEDVVIFYINEVVPPAISILAPLDGKVVVPGQSLDLQLDVDGVTLVDFGEESEGNIEGTGHIRFYLDDGVDDDYLATSANTSVQLSLPGDLAAGDHSLVARLYNSDGESMGLESSVSLTVPSLQIVSPISGGIYGIGADVELELEVGGLNLVAPQPDLENENGSGHYHVYLGDAEGDDFLYEGATAVADVPLPADIEEGFHTLRVTLHENNHDLLVGIEATVEIGVGSGIPLVAFLSPVGSKSVQAGGSLLVTLDVENFSLIPIEEGKENATGLGHYHIYLDAAADGDYLHAGHESTTLVALPGLITPGIHTLRVSLRNNDGTPVGVEDETNFNVVSAGNPVVTILAPIGGTPYAAGSAVPLTVEVLDLTLTEVSTPGTNVNGEGHYRVFVDGSDEHVLATHESEGSAVLPTGLGAGVHTLTVSLHENDGTPIDGALDVLILEIWDAPTVEILTPVDMSEYNKGVDIALSISVSGMALTSVGSVTENHVGEGHYHVYLDDAEGGDYLLMDAEESNTLSLPPDIEDGWHTIRVSLRNNDHSAMSGAQAEANILVQSPQVTILAPAGFSQTYALGSSLSVDVEVVGFTLVPPGSGTAIGQGHLRVYLDGADGNDYVGGLDPTVTSFSVPLDEGVGIGDHQIRVSLLNDDGSPTGTEAVAFFLVAANGVAINSPAPGVDVVAGEEITLELAFDNFTLEPVGASVPNAPDQGHYHVYLDDEDGADYLLVSADLSPVVALPSDISFGEHVLRVSLRNNDHSPLDPPCDAYLQIFVTE